MLKMSEIRELIKLIDQSSVDELELEQEGFRLSIRKSGRQAAAFGPGVLPAQQVPAPQAQPVLPVAGAAAPAGGPAAARESSVPNADAEGSSGASAGTSQDRKGLHAIVSPMVGTFYRAPAPGAEPFVKPGDRVHEKTVVCIVEAMKLMNEIEAEVSGEIVEVLVENGQLVEYGQPLFLVKTD